MMKYIISQFGELSQLNNEKDAVERVYDMLNALELPIANVSDAQSEGYVVFEDLVHDAIVMYYLSDVPRDGEIEVNAIERMQEKLAKIALLLANLFQGSIVELRLSNKKRAPTIMIVE